MKKENIKKGLLMAVGKMTSAEVERNKFGWPPLCIGIYHQPKRPVDKKI